MAPGSRRAVLPATPRRRPAPPKRPLARYHPGDRKSLGRAVLNRMFTANRKKSAQGQRLARLHGLSTDTGPDPRDPFRLVRGLGTRVEE